MAYSKKKKKSSTSVSDLDVTAEALFEQAETESLPEEELEMAPAPKPVLKEEPVVEEPPADLSKVKKAIPAAIVSQWVTTKALKTTVKFCGQWVTLVKGKNITASADQIAYLRSRGLVE